MPTTLFDATPGFSGNIAPFMAARSRTQRQISPDLLDQALQEILRDYALRSGERIDELTHAAVVELVELTRSTAPRGSGLGRFQINSFGDRQRSSRPHFHTSIAWKKLQGGWFGASRYLWYVNAPNYRVTHLIAKPHASRSGGTVRANPFLVNALQQVLTEYEEAIRRYFVE